MEVTITSIQEPKGITIEDLKKAVEFIEAQPPRITHWEVGKGIWDMLSALPIGDDGKIHGYYGLVFKLNTDLRPFQKLPVFKEYK